MLLCQGTSLQVWVAWNPFANGGQKILSTSCVRVWSRACTFMIASWWTINTCKCERASFLVHKLKSRLSKTRSYACSARKDLGHTHRFKQKYNQWRRPRVHTDISVWKGKLATSGNNSKLIAKLKTPIDTRSSWGWWTKYSKWCSQNSNLNQTQKSVKMPDLNRFEASQYLPTCSSKTWFGSTMAFRNVFFRSALQLRHLQRLFAAFQFQKLIDHFLHLPRSVFGRKSWNFDVWKNMKKTIHEIRVATNITSQRCRPRSLDLKHLETLRGWGRLISHHLSNILTLLFP